MENQGLNEFKDKTILVTGGTGSIGSRIVEQLLPFGPRQIRVFSRDESKQFELMNALDSSAPVNFLIGDVRDKERLHMAMENVDIVFHAAAMKHVVSCEKNPFEAIKTNVQGTQNIIECAYSNEVDKVILVSTDKAADPTNVMGCTKLLAEKLILASFLYKGHKKTKFCSVRFGNVYGSRGSVVPLFINQLKSGKPLTLTDPGMTRFFMSISQAVGLVLKAAELMRNREIFVLKMPVLNMGDLAQAVIEIFKEKNNLTSEVPIKIIGKKEGERMHEKLLTTEEAQGTLELEDMFVILPSLLNISAEYEFSNENYYAQLKNSQVGEYCSQDVAKMSIEQIKKLLLSNKDFNFSILK